jgi:hypothetical protein
VYERAADQCAEDIIKWRTVRFPPSGVVRKRSCGQPSASAAEISKRCEAVLIPRSTWARRTDPHGDVPSRRPNRVTRMGYDSALPGPQTNRYAGHVAGSLTRPIGWRQYAVPVRRLIPTSHCDQYVVDRMQYFSFADIISLSNVGDTRLYFVCRR